jgi:hypothetical protein
MMNQSLHSQKRIFSWAVLLTIAMAAFFSCSKEGTLETVPEFSQVIFEVRSLKQAPVLYELKVGDYTVDDSITITRTLTSAIEKSSAEQRLLITEILSNTILLDTMIVIPSMGARYTIYQVDTAEGSKPLFIAAGQQSNIPADTFMQAFYLKDPKYPDVIDVNVFEVKPDGTAGLVHSFDDVSQGEFTEFIPLAIQGSYKIEARTSDGELIPRIAPVDPETGSGGLPGSRCDYSANNYQVSRFTSRTIGANVFYSIACMFQY